MKSMRNWKFLVVIVAAVGLASMGVFAQAQEKKAPAKPAAGKVTVLTPPIGTPRTDKEFGKDVADLLFDRRVSVSDLPGGIAFKPKDCMRCHENEPEVEGQIFYGYPDFKKDVKWPNYIGNAEKKIAPSLKYNFVETHKKKAKLTPKGNPEQILKQNQ